MKDSRERQLIHILKWGHSTANHKNAKVYRIQAYDIKYLF